MDEQLLLSKYKNCNLCHRRCGTDRTKQTGFCGMPDGLFAARAALHYWEEPCLCGECGSGTVFFSGCSLRCVFCQNHDIAFGLSGKRLEISRLAEIFLELQEKGAANINLVTPTHYVPSVLAALERARNAGLFLPVVYNTGNYETVETLKMLEGYVDVYLPDFKYWSPELARRYCSAPGYAEHAKANLAEMFRQVGRVKFSEKSFSSMYRHKSSTDIPGMAFPGNGTTPSPGESCFMTRGILVRHLALPGALSDSKQIIQYLYETYGDDIYLSIMNQYTPIAKNLTGFPELNRKLTSKEYDSLIDFAIDLGVENAFIQEGDTAEESFIPAFCGEGI